MTDLFKPFLEKSEVVVLDGALATELERRGADLRDSLWSARILVEAPDLIREVHLDYLRAGANVLTSASYQATFEGLARIGLSEKESAQILQLSVRLAKDAREEYLAESTLPEPVIAASVGSYGAFLADGSEYSGEYGLSIQQLKAFHRKRIEALVAASPDLLAFETVPCQKEGEAIVELMEEFPGVRAWLSFSCHDEEHVCHGELFRDCVQLANQSEQIVAVGLNCTSPDVVESLLNGVRGVTNKHILAYPNSGEEWDPENRSWIASEEEFNFCVMARRWYAAGASLIGGCCRTSPKNIEGIRREFSKE